MDTTELALAAVAAFLLLHKKQQAPSTANAPAKTNSTSYTVKSGDSLAAIAGQFYGSSYQNYYGAALLALANGIDASVVARLNYTDNSIQPGQVLTIPALSDYTSDQQSQAHALASQASGSGSSSESDPSSASTASEYQTPDQTPSDANYTEGDGTQSFQSLNE